MTAANRRYRFRAALVDGNWIDQALVEVDPVGRLISVRATPGDPEQTPFDATFPWVALPAMANVHSHAFQRGFVGLSEFRTATRDSFWTWRQQMFAFLAELQPDQIRIVARQLYLEMLMGGYASVGEFHYLHNQPGGEPYQDPAELAAVHLQAAEEAGIAICLIPVLYQRGGFDDSPLAYGQNRFGMTVPAFLALMERCRELVRGPDQHLGVALHSLRAVSVAAGREALAGIVTNRNPLPVHIHVAEQQLEVDDCLAAHGRRPVEFLLEHFPVDRNWCLIHSTHLSAAEVASLARSGAVAGLCPSTEGNLGDGFFPTRDYLEQGGLFAIGSDSHCTLDFREELRWIEYVQRLQRRERAVLGTTSQSVGRRLFDAAVAGGNRALGWNAGRLAVGERADLMLVDPDHPALGGVSGDRLLDRLVFAQTPGLHSPLAGMMVGGKLHDFRSADWAARFAESSREFRQLTPHF